MLLKRAPSAAERATADALRLDPRNVLALRIRATALFALEQADGLQEIAEELEHSVPMRGWGALARGAYHILRKEPTPASSWLKTAEADPEPETRLTAAAGWLMINRPFDAERVFKSVLEVDPTNASAEIGSAIASIARRDFLGAEAALQRSGPGSGRSSIYRTMAQVYHETGRKAQADAMKAVARRLEGSAR
jgi:Tfp pilus assembly protein PilF